MKYVFICSPYRPVGEDPETELRKNIDQAKRACRLAVSRGLIPLAPHLYFDDNDPQERKAYERTVEKYTWLLHKKELVDKAPEIRRQLENMIQISDMAIPENWKEIVNQLGH